eukprot:539405_1
MALDYQNPEYKKYKALNNDHNRAVYGIGQTGFGKFGDPNMKEISVFSDLDKNTEFSLHKLDWSNHITNIKFIACGQRYNSFLNYDGIVWSSGCNVQGNLGVNYPKELRNYDLPLKVKLLENKFIDKIIVGTQSEHLWCLTLDNSKTHIDTNHITVIKSWIRLSNANKQCNNIEMINYIVKFIGYKYEIYGAGEQLKCINYPIRINYFDENNIFIIDIITGSYLSIFVDMTYKLWTFGSCRDVLGSMAQKTYIKPKWIDIAMDINIRKIVINDSYCYIVCNNNQIISFKSYFPDATSFDDHDIEYVKPLQMTSNEYFKLYNIEIMDINVSSDQCVILDTDGYVYLITTNSVNTKPQMIEYFQENNIVIRSIHCGEHHMLFKAHNGDIYSMGSNLYYECCVVSGSNNILVPHLIDLSKHLFSHQDVTDIFCGTNTTFLVVNET